MVDSVYYSGLREKGTPRHPVNCQDFGIMVKLCLVVQRALRAACCGHCLAITAYLMLPSLDRAESLRIIHGGSQDDRVVCIGHPDVVHYKRSDIQWVTAQQSVTAILDMLFQAADSMAVCADRFAYWRDWAVRNSIMDKYWNGLINEQSAIADIIQVVKMSKSIEEKTHRVLSIHINVALLDWNRMALKSNPSIQPEVRMFTEWAKSQQFVPIRTDLPVVHTNGDIPVCGGVIDLVAQRLDGSFFMIAWKCTGFDVGPYDRSFGVASPPFKNTEFDKCSLRLSFLAEMAATTHGYDVGDAMYILVMNRTKMHARLVQCANYRAFARHFLAQLCTE